VPWVIVSSIYAPLADFLASLLFLTAFICLNLMAVYWREEVQEQRFILKQIADKEVEKTEKLLMHLMPPHVYFRLKADQQ
jgi:hypothetical protein